MTAGKPLPRNPTRVSRGSRRADSAQTYPVPSAEVQGLQMWGSVDEQRTSWLNHDLDCDVTSTWESACRRDDLKPPDNQDIGPPHPRTSSVPMPCLLLAMSLEICLISLRFCSTNLNMSLESLLLHGVFMITRSWKVLTTGPSTEEALLWVLAIKCLPCS